MRSRLGCPEEQVEIQRSLDNNVKLESAGSVESDLPGWPQLAWRRCETCILPNDEEVHNLSERLFNKVELHRSPQEVDGAIITWICFRGWDQRFRNGSPPIRHPEWRRVCRSESSDAKITSSIKLNPNLKRYA